MSPFTNPYVAKFLTLRTRLSPEECCRRLQLLTLPWMSIMLVIPWAFSRLPLMGWVDPTGFAVRKRTVSRNVSFSMQPEAKTQFTVAPDGTRMRVRLGVRRWVMILNSVGTIYVALYLVGFMLLFRFLGYPRFRGRLVVVPLLFFALLEAFAWWDWKWFREEEAFLITFLKQTLEAEEVPELPAQRG
jgi:hypothetical protein